MCLAFTTLYWKVREVAYPKKISTKRNKTTRVKVVQLGVTQYVKIVPLFYLVKLS